MNVTDPSRIRGADMSSAGGHGADAGGVLGAETRNQKASEGLNEGPKIFNKGPKGVNKGPKELDKGPKGLNKSPKAESESKPEVAS
jgi:hypothetical protein